VLEEHLYVGIRRHDRTWEVRPVEDVTETDLLGVEIERDLQCTVVVGRDEAAAAHQIALQARSQSDPFRALDVEVPHSPGLELVRHHVRRANSSPPPPLHVPDSRVPSNPLGSVVAAHERELLERWEAAVRARIASASTITHEQFLNCLPLLLEVVSDLSAQPTARKDLPRRSAAARVHGAQRHTLGWSVGEIVQEFQLLSECAADISREAGLSDPSGHRELSRLVAATAAESLEEFKLCEEKRLRKEELKRVGFLVHELRNPLSTARIAWEAIVAAGQLKEPFVEGMNLSLTRLTERIDQLLASARLADRSDEAPLEREAVAITKLVADAHAESRADAEHKGLRLFLLPGPEVEVLGDYRLLLSALTNLVRNAVKYTHRGCDIFLQSRVEEGRVLIEVEDACGGLPPDRAERLFEAFTQAHDNRSGFGLGLAIAKQAVEAHGGTLMVRNQPPIGCVFVVDLPLAS
jgi:signal transduction histidine kinase